MTELRNEGQIAYCGFYCQEAFFYHTVVIELMSEFSFFLEV
jgi:hypothetical protein